MVRTTAETAALPEGVRDHGRRRASIRRRLALLILLVALPIAAERMYALLAERDRLVADTLASLRITAEMVSLAQRETLSSVQATVQTLSRQATLLLNDLPACDAYLRRLNQNIFGMQGAVLAGVDGRVKCASNRALVGVNLSDRAYVSEALAQIRPVLSDMVVTRNIGSSILVMAEAQRDEAGDPVALAAVGVDLSSMSRLAAQAAAAHPGITVQILDAKGTILVQFPRNGVAIGRMLGDHDVFRRTELQSEGTFEALGFEGEPRYFAFMRLAETKLRVLASIDQSRVAGEIDDRLFRFLALQLLGILLLMGVTWYLAQRMVVAPVRQLARDVSAVGREEASRIGDVEVEEFQPLVAAFGDMSRRLAERNGELRSLAGRLGALAHTDGLTGLANRRTFDVQFSEDWVRARDSGGSIALVMLDVDNFKLFNDTRGHPAGDDALRGVARMISAAVAGTGYLGARYGGEEFIILMSGTDLSGAIDFAEDIRRLVVAMGIEHPRVPSRVLTASFGVAAMVPGEKDYPDSLLAAADLALYEAKRHGRNRVVAAPAGDPAAPPAVARNL
ncbi:MAG: hypothetical protein B7Z15_05760 [Rhizobiales bacterium 32-66-8]|nr:MAG: hypothetical protein B7Z15_05760 [Rhizobiales bacterium 32-66-8]